MAKRLQFFVLLCLLCMLPGYTQGTKKFCFSEDLSGSFPTLNFFQKTDDAATGETCFEYWFSDGVTDAVSFVNNWLSNNSNGILSLASDVEFAGRNGGTCVESPLAFKGKSINMGGSQILESGTGGPYTISGPCFHGGILGWNPECDFLRCLFQGNGGQCQCGRYSAATKLCYGHNGIPG